MPKPILQREVLLPSARGSGATVVFVAAMAMFATVAVSALSVRTTTHCRTQLRAVSPSTTGEHFDEARLRRQFFNALGQNRLDDAATMYESLADDSPNRERLARTYDKIQRKLNAFDGD